jgi:YVTN family beta-propeller protein
VPEDDDDIESEDGCPELQVTDSIKLGNGAFNSTGIALNPVTNRVYVANVGSSNVTVIYATANSIITNIPVSPQPAAIAVNPVTNRIFVYTEVDDLVSVIDGATNAVMATIPMGDDGDDAAYPKDMVVNSVTNRVYLSDHDTAGAPLMRVIDGNSNALVASVPLPRSGSERGATTCCRHCRTAFTPYRYPA